MIWYGSGFSLLIMVLLLLTNTGACQKGCKESRCGRHGPRIRFPFRLKGNDDPDHCGYPGFDLTCTDKHETVLEFPAIPLPIKLLVTRISYEYQYLEVSVSSDPQNCLPRESSILNQSSNFPLQFTLDYRNVSFFNCSPDAQDKSSCRIYAAGYGETLLSSNLVSCTKMFDISSSFRGPYEIGTIDLSLSWWTPDCRQCEAKGQKCKLKNNTTRDEIECFDRDPNPIKKMLKSIILAATGVTVGFVVLVLVLFAFYRIYRHFKMKGEDQARVEKFLEDYRALKPTRFSYADIKRITNNFQDKLGEGAHGAVFKGKLSNEILVAVKILNNTEGDGKEFINEVGTMGKIHHVNVVRLLGFCADGFHRALVHHFFPNGSLQNFISPPDNKNIFLGWEKLQEIALSIAKGIEYLHQGCDYRILHFDINPHNVLLDDNLTPKITDFGLAKLCSRNRSTVSMTAARGTLGYIAPEVFSRNFGNVSYKSDIYSYGMLLLEMVGGRKNIGMSSDEETFEVLYPDWIHNLLQGEDVRVYIERDEDIKFAKKLAIVGLWCIQWHPVDRPSIKTVVQMLEGDGEKLTVPPSPFDSTNSTITSAVIPARRLNLELEVIHE